MFQKLFEPFLKRIYPCTIDPEGIRQSTRKELRIIDTLEPVMNQHRLVVDEQVIKEDLKEEDKTYQLFYQMTRITRDKGCLKHDDRLDVLAIAVGYWTSQMNKDVETTIQEERDRLMDIELRRYMDHVYGEPQKAEETMF
jgi:hypothetical protein